MSSIVEMCVHMDCQGCERKIKRALEKMEGVRGIEIDMERQKVTVTGSVKHEKVLKAVQKTGRKAVLWPYNHHSNGNVFTDQEHYENQRHHPALVPQNTASSYYEDVSYYSSSNPSYNYYTHGYGTGYGSYGYQYYPPQPAALMYPVRVGQRAGDMFSDENPNACSIM